MGAIIWLASYPKSGNTWIRAFLHNLFLDRPEPAPINALNDFCLGEDKAEYYNNFDRRPCTEMTPREIAELRPKVHDLLTKAYPDSVFVKTHNYLGEWEGFPLVNMECTAGAIYLVRNPLDVAVSSARFYGVTIDQAIAWMAHPGMGSPTTDTSVRQVYGTWSTHLESWTQNPMPSLHVTRYEDMLNQPFKTFGGVAKFLGLDPPRARLQRAIANSSFRSLRKQEDERGFVERSQHAHFFRVGRAGQWRKVLSEEQVRRIVSDHREQMKRFKYLPKGY